jgi:glucokinase
VSPGTGLGECILVRDGRGLHPIASEAGHADFAPRTDDEIDLLRFLRARFGRASAEHVVSGPGLVNVFDWLRESGRLADDSGIDPPAGESAPAREISARALAGSSRICIEALRLWVRALASEAGNVALRGLTTGGVDLGGGIPAKVLPFLREPGAFDPFFAKPPQDELLRSIPIRVVTTPETTLRGAAIAARERAGASPREAQGPR